MELLVSVGPRLLNHAEQPPAKMKEHFDTPEEASEAYEKKQEENLTSSMSKEKDVSSNTPTKTKSKSKGRPISEGERAAIEYLSIMAQEKQKTDALNREKAKAHSNWNKKVSKVKNRFSTADDLNSKELIEFGDQNIELEEAFNGLLQVEDSRSEKHIWDHRMKAEYIQTSLDSEIEALKKISNKEGKNPISNLFSGLTKKGQIEKEDHEKRMQILLNRELKAMESKQEIGKYIQELNTIAKENNYVPDKRTKLNIENFKEFKDLRDKLRSW